MVMSREVRRAAGRLLGQESLGPELRAVSRLLLLSSVSPLCHVYETAPSALMNFCAFINLTHIWFCLASAPSLHSLHEAAFDLDLTYVTCVYTLLCREPHRGIRTTVLSHDTAAVVPRGTSLTSLVS